MQNSEKGFTLIEVVMSAMVVLIVASISMQLLVNPKKRVLELEMKSQAIKYMDLKMREIKAASSFDVAATPEFCSPASGTGFCNTNICGNLCGQRSAVCAGSSGDDLGRLAAMVQQIPSMCFVHAEINMNCGGTGNDRATQVCMKIKWPKRGSEFYEEALTAFLAK